MKRKAAGAIKQPPWQMLLNSIVDLMNTEIELGFTFAQVAKTSRNPETKARNVRNAWKAYETVAEFLAAKDVTQGLMVGIAGRLSLLRQELDNLEEARKQASRAQLA